MLESHPLFDSLPVDKVTTSDQNYEKLSNRNIVRIGGPFAVGKTTCIEQLVKRDSSFSRVKGFTNRQKRPSEENLPESSLPHKFLSTLDDYDWLLKKFENGLIAHVSRHPTGGFIMGSTVDEFEEAKYPIIDLSYNAIPLLPSKLRPIFLVADPASMRTRMQERVGLADYESRALDARQTLDWGIDNKNKILWIENSQGRIHDTVEDIISAAATGEHNNQVQNILLAKRMLKELY